LKINESRQIMRISGDKAWLVSSLNYFFRGNGVNPVKNP
jgi:hypothetical protein